MIRVLGLPSRSWPITNPALAGVVGVLLAVQLLTDLTVNPAFERHSLPLGVTAALLVTGAVWTALSRVVEDVHRRCLHELLAQSVAAVGWTSYAYLAYSAGTLPMNYVIAAAGLGLTTEAMVKAWRKGLTQARVSRSVRERRARE